VDSTNAMVARRIKRPLPPLLRPSEPLLVGHAARPHGTPRVLVRDLDFYYGDVHALKGVNLGFDDHCITALIGPSGCGKSTLIRVLNRIFDYYPDQRATGEVWIDGKNILSGQVDMKRMRARIGMTFQRPHMLPMSIYENVAFGIRLHEDLGRAGVNDRVEEALRGAALWDEVKDRLRRPASSLSGGQQQRLCIARSIALNPEILLFDEPCSALDPLSTLKIEDLLNSLREKYCVIIITHNMQQAARVSDYVAFMYLGELLEYGTAKEIFVSPQHEYTRAYITGRFS
jgi:phosphate transport system ATP-binding protein